MRDGQFADALASAKAWCVFRKSVTGVFGIVTGVFGIVTGVFGIVTGVFGNVTGHFGDVTGGPTSVS